jgi:hypothetical protein
MNSQHHIKGDTLEDLLDTWHHAGDVASMAVWDAANRAKDRDDEALDAMRVSGGMTLDEYLASK